MKSRLTLHRNCILDAVRRRFHVRRGENRLDLLMERDHFSAELPIEVDHDLNRIRFCVEDASEVDHSTRVTLGGLRGGRYRVLREGKEVAVCGIADGKESVVRLPVCAGDKAARIEITKV